MDKEKVKEKMGVWKKRLAFLKPWNMDEEDQDDDLEIRSMQANDTSREAREESPEFTWFKGKNGKLYLAGGIAALVLLVAGGFWYYSGHHLFTEYVVTSTAESLDIAGTQYAMLGSSVIKYSPDGVFCVDSHNTAKWSVAYSMQSPIIDICKNTMVVAEQQGNQVYVMNEKGPMGNFETDLPVLKACVSAQGVVALVQEDDPVTWVNLYDCNGTKLAGVKTTMEDSGYPLDAAITENGEKLMVSFLGVTQGELKGRVAFYDFSSGLANGDNSLTGILDIRDRFFRKSILRTVPLRWDSGITALLCLATENPRRRSAASLSRARLSAVSTMRSMWVSYFTTRQRTAATGWSFTVTAEGGPWSRSLTAIIRK